MSVDPRTMLPLATVPPRLLPAFASVQGCLLHWIGPARKVALTLKEAEKVCIVGDAALYICDFDATIRRCIVFAELRDLITRADDDAVGFRMTAKAEYDIVLRFGMNDVGYVVNAIKRIYWAHMSRELPVMDLGAADPIHPHVNLTKPPGWTMKMEPLRPRRYLEKLIADQDVAFHRHVEEVHDEFVRIKNELQHALESCRNQQYDRMVQQCASYVQKLANKDAYVQLLRGEMARARTHILDSAAADAVDRMLAVSDPAFVASDADRMAALLLNRPNADAVTTSAGGGGASAFATSFITGRREASLRGTAVSFGQLGGEERAEGCESCAQLRSLLEEHPNLDKRRVLAAEEALATARRELDLARAAAEPAAREMASMRDALGRADAVLADQRLSLQDRVRAAGQFTTPYAVLAATKGGMGGSKGNASAAMKVGVHAPMNVPPPADVTALTAEVLTLRGVLRDASSLHMAELHKLQRQFDVYDEAMVAAVRLALESSGVALSNNPKTLAEGVVARERDRVLRLLASDNASQPDRGGGSPTRRSQVGASSALAPTSPLLNRSGILQASVAGYTGFANSTARASPSPTRLFAFPVTPHSRGGATEYDQRSSVTAVEGVLGPLFPSPIGAGTHPRSAASATRSTIVAMQSPYASRPGAATSGVRWL
jgi:hypothetical protein